MRHQYVYSALNRRRSIRLIQVQRFETETVEIGLFEVSLSSAPPYNALSYSWDGQSPDRHIVCDGKDLSVTPNCEAALRRLRLDERYCTIWIDAICINQESSVERNAQVQIMGEIYSKAQNVLIWLGEATIQSEVAFQFLHNASRVISNDRLTHEQYERLMLEYRGNLIQKTVSQSFKLIRSRIFWSSLWQHNRWLLL